MMTNSGSALRSRSRFRSGHARAVFSNCAILLQAQVFLGFFLLYFSGFVSITATLRSTGRRIIWFRSVELVYSPFCFINCNNWR
jgi:hypothetical protein